MSKTNINLMFLIGALFFSMSSLPGFHKNSEVQTMDLLSIDCDIVGKLKKDGKAECLGLRMNKVEGTLQVEKIDNDSESVVITAGVTNCEICDDGVRKISRTVKTKDLQKVSEALFVQIAKETEQDNVKAKKLARAQELCFKNSEGEEITKLTEQIKCRIGKMSEMDEEKAAKYYRENVKDKLQELMTSENPEERMSGRSLVNSMGREMNISCKPRSMPAGMNNPFVNPITSNFSSKSEEMSGRTFVEESACDMLAFSVHSQNLENMSAALKMPNANRPALLQAMSGQQAIWGNYFQNRGLQLKTPANGFAGDVLFTDVYQNDHAIKANYDEIIKAHQGFLNTANPSAQAAVANNGRLLRGGIANAPGLASGTVSTQLGARQPWPATAQTPAQAQALAAQQRMGVQSVTPAANKTVPFAGAPKMGQPVR